MTSRMTIRWCLNARKSLIDSLSHHRSRVERDKTRDKIETILERLESGEPLPSSWTNVEEVIPSHGSKRFYAVVAGDQRLYYWGSTKFTGVIYVSHAVFKNYQKLKRSDVDRVDANYREIEMNEGWET